MPPKRRGYDAVTLEDAGKASADKLAEEISTDFMEGLDMRNTKITCRSGILRP